MKSLQASHNQLSDTFIQLRVLNSADESIAALPKFHKKLESAGLLPFKPATLDTLQINVGKMCNQTCKHCHVDAGPDRKEIMTRYTMQQCLDALAKSNISTVDLTGGAPEMNPDFEWFVEEIRKLGRKVIVRCNLTIIVANKRYNNLPKFFKKNQVEVVSSLPYYTSHKTDSQRGDGVFDDSITALKMLNEVGYGIQGSGLTLNLVYNPSGAFFPPPQEGLQTEFKHQLLERFGIVFNELFAITNLPISRFLDYLMVSGNYDSYMEKLVNTFNPVAAQNVMCKSMISVGWDGYLYDCDFNQMLDLKINKPNSNHIADFNIQQLINRNIIINQHCFGCTAGAGSSCGGEIA
ncbi:MAG: arsenosugar biosynthesis radical SAM protein ArsS [Flavobacterium sp.]|nr:arsenosugar biosynthesis radical SAM protein ArsS [Pedobacter sp.]